jgi:hypothetical protein
MVFLAKSVGALAEILRFDVLALAHVFFPRLPLQDHTVDGIGYTQRFQEAHEIKSLH